MDDCLLPFERDAVTPRAGVWIEMKLTTANGLTLMSLPVRECGLKSFIVNLRIH